MWWGRARKGRQGVVGQDRQGGASGGPGCDVNGPSVPCILC